MNSKVLVQTITVLPLSTSPIHHKSNLQYHYLQHEGIFEIQFGSNILRNENTEATMFSVQLLHEINVEWCLDGKNTGRLNIRRSIQKQVLKKLHFFAVAALVRYLLPPVQILTVFCACTAQHKTVPEHPTKHAQRHMVYDFSMLTDHANLNSFPCQFINMLSIPIFSSSKHVRFVQSLDL